MAERNERSALNRLIEVCRDGERGFRYAANHVEDHTIKAAFLDLAAQRERCAGELVPHAQRLGGHDAADGTAGAAVHRGWMTLKDIVRGGDAPIVAEAARGEEVAAGAYREALEYVFPPATRDLVERQSVAVQDALWRVRMLGRDATRAAGGRS